MKSSGLRQSSPPEDITYFLDRALGRNKIAKSLRQSGHKVEIHDEHFRLDSPDNEWIPKVSQNGWVILTKDKMILNRVPELLAIYQSKARFFAITSGNLTAEEMSEIFKKALKKIQKNLKHWPPPFAAKIGSGGNIDMALTSKKIKARLKKLGI
jgi:predicted nuclease of predicted toxin-antitoxin system